jgi:hypothetical protein
MLGEEYRVLNFGVPAYGLGQSYLRYKIDVVKWKPKVVIFGFIDRDLRRTMRVYPFISSNWSLPFSKPRFLLQDGDIRNVNMSPLPPEEIFAKETIADLPLLEHDIGYRPSDWQKRWYHSSYLVRLIISLCPAWSSPRSEFSEEAILAVNTAIIRTFIRSVEHEGSIPLVVWFPTRTDLQTPSSHPSLGKRMLEQAGMAYIDPTPGLLALDPADRFLDDPYSPQGHSAVANCLVSVVQQTLTQAANLLGEADGKAGQVKSHLKAGAARPPFWQVAHQPLRRWAWGTIDQTRFSGRC